MIKIWFMVLDGVSPSFVNFYEHQIEDLLNCLCGWDENPNREIAKKRLSSMIPGHIQTIEGKPVIKIFEYTNV